MLAKIRRSKFILTQQYNCSEFYEAILSSRMQKLIMLVMLTLLILLVPVQSQPCEYEVLASYVECESYTLYLKNMQ